MANHNELGDKGEKIAQEYLTQKKYQILNTNWRFGKDEIDIIASIEEYLVFVEVKTRNTHFFGEPETFVSKAKQSRIIKAAQHYVEKQELDLEVRFDVIGIVLNSKEQKINHIEDAYHPRW